LIALVVLVIVIFTPIYYITIPIVSIDNIMSSIIIYHLILED